MVGDQVEVEEVDWIEYTAVISKLFPRYSELSRPAIANIDQILLMFALAEPVLDPYQLSSFLVKAESIGVEVSLCLNKCDLLEVTEQQQWLIRLKRWGYNPFLLSLRNGKGLEDLTQCLHSRTTVLAGPSGVGKSSLINYLIPKSHQRINSVSGKLARGRHTTRHVELFKLPTSGLIADTPGFNRPDLTCLPANLASYFLETRQYLADGECQFRNCLHREEPNCVVRGNWERYKHYLTLLQSALEYQHQQSQRKALRINTKGVLVASDTDTVGKLNKRKNIRKHQ
ncbi:ribosome small subunit-dependent GTPase A [Microcoleus sp. S28C3]|uniref:ribosome small subunit-dependent GTPase A n=1 Tax=Microcoleus sp. S28C3 TaxID=3055414 RepID=UPI002FD08F16